MKWVYFFDESKVEDRKDLIRINKYWQPVPAGIANWIITKSGSGFINIILNYVFITSISIVH